MAKSEENRLVLKFDFTFYRVSQHFWGGLLVPILDTRFPKKTGRIYSQFVDIYHLVIPPGVPRVDLPNDFKT